MFIILYRLNAAQYERDIIYKNISGTIILFSKNFLLYNLENPMYDESCNLAGLPKSMDELQSIV